MAREGDVAGYRRGDGIAADQAGDNILGPALCGARIDEGIVLSLYRRPLRVNRQLSIHRRNHIVFRHVLRVVHNLKIFIDDVVAISRFGYVGHAARGRCYQLVAR